MNKSISSFLSVALLACSMVFAVSCTEDEPPLPDNLAAFEAGEQGFSTQQANIKITLSRAEKVATAVTVEFATDKVTYGEEFTTTPAATANTILLTIPAGQTEGLIVVTKTDGIFLNGDESITFTISGTEPVVIGAQPTIKLSFAAITSTGGTLTLEGKTDASNYTNNVFADLSANAQTLSNRKNWALGFYTGTEFRVTLNHSFQMLATASSKTDIDAVTQADAEASGLYNFNAFVENPNALSYVDYWDGDLTKTAIAQVSATDADNKVYFIRTEAGPLNDATKWYKVRVLRNGTGYRLQYAKVTETTHRTVDIAKGGEYMFKYISLDNSADGTSPVVEPEKKNWDLEWAYSTYNSGLNTPYWFQDFVLINYLDGAEAAQIISADATAAATAYTNFNEAGITGLTFSRTRDAIGDKWRVTTGTGIRRDRFYVLRDPHGNVYKLKFNTMGVGGDGGVRGRPVIEYALVKKAS